MSCCSQHTEEEHRRRREAAEEMQDVMTGILERNRDPNRLTYMLCQGLSLTHALSSRENRDHIEQLVRNLLLSMLSAPPPELVDRAMEFFRGDGGEGSTQPQPGAPPSDTPACSPDPAK